MQYIKIYQKIALKTECFNMIIALFIQSYINISNLTDSKKKADMMSIICRYVVSFKRYFDNPLLLLQDITRTQARRYLYIKNQYTTAYPMSGESEI
jgi:hypothetical protein